MATSQPPTGARIDSSPGVRAPVAESARTALGDVLTLALEQVSGCTAAGLSLAVDGMVQTIAATGETARSLDRVQYRHEDGPCLAALRAGEPVACEDYRSERRWPAVVRAARTAGVASSLSLPLVTGSARVGALNLYSESSGAFDARARRIAAALARHSTVILDTVERIHRQGCAQQNPAAAQPPREQPTAASSPGPVEAARRLAQQLATAEEHARDLWATLRQHPQAADEAAVRSAQHCYLLIQDALTAGAIEVASILGVPDDQLPT